MAARWTVADDRVLRGLYEAGASLHAIAAQVRRSEQAVSERRRALGVPARPRMRRWTTTEDALLVAAAAGGVPTSTVAKRLGRPAEQVRRRRRHLAGPGSSSHPYAAGDDERLRDCWERGGDVESLARELGRSVASVRLRAQALGLHRPRPRPRWRPLEDAVVRDGYEQALSCAQIAEQLPGRTSGAVAARAAKLGIATYARAWSQLDDRHLRALVGEGLPAESIAQTLGRTPQALALRARKLRVAVPAPRVAPRSALRWTATEDELLQLHRALNPAALAELLGRSPSAVTQRMRRLDLLSGRSPHHLVARRGSMTPGERVTAVRELRAGGPGRALAVAQRLNLTPAAVRAAAAQTARGERSRLPAPDR